MDIDPQDRADIQEILKRRANEIASFKEDSRIAFPSSVEMALTNEIERLRRLADVVCPEPTFIDCIMGSSQPFHQ